MEKNGLSDRGRERKVGMWIFGIFGFFFISFFLSPSLLTSGTVPELDGRANAFDYMTVDGKFSSGNDGKSETFAWTELDP